MTQRQEMDIGDELRAFIGREVSRRTSQPVEVSDIRKWAIAGYWPETPPRVFWDGAYARKTRFGGIVAPEDFNPFAWSIDPPETFLTDEDLRGPVERIGLGWNILNGGGGHEYHGRIRPGDVISAVAVLDDIYIRQGKQWPMIFFIRKSKWTNQNSEMVRITTSIGIRY
ncbi:MAG: MaoC family dehydratase N-terminal domain-containing protein [Dehalococcoidia bacterium]